MEDQTTLPSNEQDNTAFLAALQVTEDFRPDQAWNVPTITLAMQMVAWMRFDGHQAHPFAALVNRQQRPWLDWRQHISRYFEDHLSKTEIRAISLASFQNQESMANDSHLAQLTQAPEAGMALALAEQYINQLKAHHLHIEAKVATERWNRLAEMVAKSAYTDAKAVIQQTEIEIKQAPILQVQGSIWPLLINLLFTFGFITEINLKFISGKNETIVTSFNVASFIFPILWVISCYVWSSVRKKRQSQIITEFKRFLEQP